MGDTQIRLASLGSRDAQVYWIRLLWSGLSGKMTRVKEPGKERFHVSPFWQDVSPI